MKTLIDIPNIPKNDHQRWVLTHGGIILDNLTNGEVMQKMFPQIEVRDSEVPDWHICVSFNPNEPWEWFDKDWWNRKWGE